MQLTINGEGRSMEDGLTVTALLEHLELDPGATVVERNGDILNRDDYGAVVLADGDALELVRFVGGG